LTTNGDYYDDDGDDDGHLTPKNRRIRQLNHQGYSLGQISKILKDEGMGISKQAINERLKEMRMDPSNKIQMNFKRTGGIPKEKLRWYRVIARLKSEVAAYTVRMGFKPSVRTMFYQFVDEGIVDADEYGAFNNKATDARLGYLDQEGKLLLPLLPIDCFADDSLKLEENYDDSSPKEMEPPGEIEDPDEYINSRILELKRAPGYYDGEGDTGEDGEVGGRWYNQPEYVEVWQEKNDLMPGFEKILEGVSVNLRGNKGYSSLSFLHESTQDLKKEMQRKGFDVSQIYILYCGDWDPSGENIDDYIQRRLKQLGLVGINFIRVAVTPEQIDEYDLPLLPIEQGKDKKTPNPNMKEFIRLHGEKATHLNAFFTERNFPIFKEILLDAVNEHWDEGIHNEMVDEYDIQADDPPKLSDEELKEASREMYRKITEAFKPGWEKEYDDDDE
jgi:hypothetical protein